MHATTIIIIIMEPNEHPGDKKRVVIDERPQHTQPPLPWTDERRAPQCALRINTIDSKPEPLRAQLSLFRLVQTIAYLAALWTFV